jgi:hypothetical protein
MAEVQSVPVKGGVVAYLASLVQILLQAKLIRITSKFSR